MGNRRIWSSWIGVVSILTMFLVLGLEATPVLAHGEATLTVSPSVVAPGGPITIKAEGVEANETFTMTLEGMTVRITLGTVTVGDDKDFHQEFTVPADVPPGVYQMRATTAGGEVITAELTVRAETSATEQAPPAKPSAEFMQLDRRKSTSELVVIIAGLLLSAGLGLVLLRRRE